MKNLLSRILLLILIIISVTACNTYKYNGHRYVYNAKRYKVKQDVAVRAHKTIKTNEVKIEPVITASESVNPIKEVAIASTSTAPLVANLALNNIIDYRSIRYNRVPEIKNNQLIPIKKSSNSDVDLVILVLLAIFLPPLAVYLVEQVTTRFWIDLILALIGSGVMFFGYMGLAFLAAIVIALMAVLM